MDTNTQGKNVSRFVRFGHIDRLLPKLAKAVHKHSVNDLTDKITIEQLDESVVKGMGSGGFCLKSDDILVKLDRRLAKDVSMITLARMSYSEPMSFSIEGLEYAFTIDFGLFYTGGDDYELGVDFNFNGQYRELSVGIVDKRYIWKVLTKVEGATIVPLCYEILVTQSVEDDSLGIKLKMYCYCAGEVYELKTIEFRFLVNFVSGESTIESYTTEGSEVNDSRFRELRQTDYSNLQPQRYVSTDQVFRDRINDWNNFPNVLDLFEFPAASIKTVRKIKGQFLIPQTVTKPGTGYQFRFYDKVGVAVHDFVRTFDIAFATEDMLGFDFSKFIEGAAKMVVFDGTYFIKRTDDGYKLTFFKNHRIEKVGLGSFTTSANNTLLFERVNEGINLGCVIPVIKSKALEGEVNLYLVEALETSGKTSGFVLYSIVGSKIKYKMEIMKESISQYIGVEKEDGVLFQTSDHLCSDFLKLGESFPERVSSSVGTTSDFSGNETRVVYGAAGGFLAVCEGNCQEIYKPGLLRRDQEFRY